MGYSRIYSVPFLGVVCEDFACTAQWWSAPISWYPHVNEKEWSLQ